MKKYSELVDPDCKETKCIGHGSFVKCGEKEWGENSPIFYCEKCLQKIIDSFEKEKEGGER